MSRICKYHADCFSVTKKGYCQCLSDTNFKGDCPFYKTLKQVTEERKATGYSSEKYKFSKKQ